MMKGRMMNVLFSKLMVIMEVTSEAIFLMRELGPTKEGTFM